MFGETRRAPSVANPSNWGVAIVLGAVLIPLVAIGVSIPSASQSGPEAVQTAAAEAATSDNEDAQPGIGDDAGNEGTQELNQALNAATTAVSPSGVQPPDGDIDDAAYRERLRVWFNNWAHNGKATIQRMPELGHNAHWSAKSWFWAGGTYTFRQDGTGEVSHATMGTGYFTWAASDTFFYIRGTEEGIYPKFPEFGKWRVSPEGGLDTYAVTATGRRTFTPLR